MLNVRPKKQQRRNGGQSMLEAIVASGIIVTAVGAALTLVQSSINGAKFSEEQIVAYNLAREGMEVVRQIRDSNWLAGRDYDEGIVGPNYELAAVPLFDPTTNVWSLSYTGADWESNPSRVYRQVAPDGNVPVGLFRQWTTQPDSTEVTRFRRLVSLRKLCSDVGGSTANRIAYTSSAVSQPCPVGTDNVGVEVSSHVHWQRAGGSTSQVELVERLFDWR
ncbi:MAG: hypothetical protein V1738_00035 [Patescibacteria group bacterium]